MALTHGRAALEGFTAAGNRDGRASALHSVGFNVAKLGEHAEGIRLCQQALAIHRDSGDRFGEASAWDSLGLCHKTVQLRRPVRHIDVHHDQLNEPIINALRLLTAVAVLEPGDRLLLFTDGITEGRDRNGAPFCEDRLADLVHQHASDGLPAPETLRRLCHTVLKHYDGPPTDDATMMYIEWSRAAGERMTP